MSLRLMAEESEPKYFATKDYKQWVRAEIARRKWTWDHFAKQVTKKGFKTTDQNLHKFFVTQGAVGGNTTLMPGINRVLGLPMPTHFDPTSPLSRLHHALDANWDRIPEETQRGWSLMLAGYDPVDDD